MIIDKLENISRYGALIPGADKVAAYFKEHPLASLKNEKYVIGDTEYFFTPAPIVPIPLSQKRWELHRKHIDVHIILEGVDCTGWIPAHELKQSIEYNPDGDFEFFADTVMGTVLHIPAGYFVLYGPEDAHRPSIDVEGCKGKKTGFKGTM
jgi:YhcH/YjgK/YiaL family protein